MTLDQNEKYLLIINFGLSVYWILNNHFFGQGAFGLLALTQFFVFKIYSFELFFKTVPIVF